MSQAAVSKKKKAACMRASRLVIRSKVWIEVDGEPVFSKGREALFRAIDEHGSISRAAREMGISYRRAWGYIKAMEARLGVPLIRTSKGGSGGGGSRLTDDARELLSRFERLQRGIDDLVDKRFEKTFRERGI